MPAIILPKHRVATQRIPEYDVDRVQLRQPRLMVPGLYPNALTRIDWSNPHTAGLRHAFVSSSAGFDLVSGLRATKTTFNAVPTISGGSIAIPGAAYYMPNGTPYAVAGSGPFTVMVRAIGTPVTGGEVFYGNGLTGNGAHYLRYRATSSRTEFVMFSDVDGTTTSSMPLTAALDSNNCCILVGGVESSLGRVFCANLTQSNTYTFSAGSIPAASSGSDPSGTVLGNARSGTETNRTAGWFFIYVWDRFVPASESVALARDPCQFLIPA